ncbi:MAG TPA: RDD family protein [Streptosporangiaceae bacterium]
MTQPPEEPGQRPEDPGSPPGEQAAAPREQKTGSPPGGQETPDSGPATRPMPIPPAVGGTRPLPRDWAQAPPEAPDQPAYRSQVGYGSPGQPGYGTQAAYGTQARPGYGVQPQPGYGTPPGAGTEPGSAAEPGPGAQAHPGYGAPPRPASGAAPGQPGYGTQGGYGSPGQPPYGTYQPYPGTGYQYGSGQDPTLAEWWQRLLARIIDAAVILVLASPFWLPPFATYAHRIQDVQNLYHGDVSSPAAQTAISVAGSRLFASLLLAGVAGALITMAYDWIQHGLWGKTLGKRAVGTMVVTADTRSKISGRAAGGRAAVYALPSAIPIIGTLFAAVNELWLLWDKRRQCLHDKTVRTVVIKARGPGGSPG